MTMAASLPSTKMRWMLKRKTTSTRMIPHSLRMKQKF